MALLHDDRRKMDDHFNSNQARRRRWSPSRFRRRRSRCTLASVISMGLLMYAWMMYSRQSAWHQRFVATSFNETQLGEDGWPAACYRDSINSEIQLGCSALQTRYVFLRSLGSGWEGSTSIYYDTGRHENVVIKTFSDERHPFRNVVPAHLNISLELIPHRWPTEIPASIIFGGTRFESSWLQENSPPTNRGKDLVPVYDVFLAPSSSTPAHPSSAHVRNVDPQWNLVTPYLPGGTLTALARNLNQAELPEPHVPSADQFHEHFQPTFMRFLATLQSLHTADYCHNDVKSSNTLAWHVDASNSTSIPQTVWYLADLGAIREVSSPLYRTWLWRYMNQWRDCRANDLRRALKTYLTFLREASRSASGSTEDFDQAFYASHAHWASWYQSSMRVLRDQTGSEHVDMLQEVEQCNRMLDLGTRSVDAAPAIPKWYAPARLLWTAAEVRSFAVSRELDTKMGDSWRLRELRDWMVLGGWSMESYQ